MDKNRQILETLKIQPLSEEEKSSRHILGRLYGPIATSLESTRNGRKYNKDLWEKALNDDIFHEKIATKSLFLELGHPTDREETDMTKVCACIPEMPKVVDGDLYAYVDILDTPNGKLLKTFCDYGFVPGISSRGSGDIMANDEVDPETFYLETWDIVAIPAVKKARLAMCESYNGKSLRKALTESYNEATDDVKKIMKEALDNLEFNLEFPEPSDEEVANIPDSALVEGSEEIVDEIAAEIPAEDIETEVPAEDEVIEDEVKEEPVEEDEVPADIPVEEVVSKIEEVAEEIKEVVEADEDQAEAIDEVVEEKKEELLPEEESKDDESEDKENEQSDEESDEDKEAESEEESDDEVEEKSEEAIDDGMEEALNNLKEMIRQKGLLENEVKSLRAEKTVSDAEVASLKEELNKYKTGFMRVSELAAKSTAFEKEVQGLNEQLTQKDKIIKDLQNKANNVKLAESVNAHQTQVKSLTEKLDAMQKDLTASETKLNEQKVQYKNKLTEAVAVAKGYKAKYDSVMSKYIEQRASMLGVKPATIINELKENYSIKDVDDVCEELLESTIRYNNLPFSLGSTPRVKMSESKQRTKEDDDLEDLYILAGLK